MAGTAYFSTLVKNARLDAIATDLANGWIELYGGTATDSDTATSATVLVKITESGGAHSAGSPTNGINLGTAASGSIAKASGETWEGTGLADGTATWGRYYSNTKDAWVQFTVNTSGAGLTVSTTAIQTGVPVSVTACTISE